MPLHEAVALHRGCDLSYQTGDFAKAYPLSRSNVYPAAAILAGAPIPATWLATARFELIETYSRPDRAIPRARRKVNHRANA